MRAPLRQIVDHAWLRTILQRRSKQFDIEYGGYLSNHLAHGVIALGLLGADNTQIEGFAKDYETKLEPAGELKGPGVRLPPSRLQSLLGKRQEFPKLFSHYNGLVESVGVERAVRESISVLAPGMVGSALHAMIHLGYATSIQHPELVAEGLAYLHFTSVDLGATYAAPATCSAATFTEFLVTFQNAVGKAHGDHRLVELIASGPETFKDVHTSDFQRNAMAVANDEGRDLLSLYLDDMPSTDGNIEWLLDAAILLFTKTAPSNGWDFFLAHGVTCAWATTQVAHLCEPQQVSLLEKALLRTLAVSFLIQGCPKLVDMTSSLERRSGSSWEELAKYTSSLTHVDEHVYKVVQVVADRHESGKGMLPERLYKDTAHLVLERPNFVSGAVPGLD